MSKWHALPRRQKRLHGWASYQLASWCALIWPEAIDRAMHNTLTEQFEFKEEQP